MPPAFEILIPTVVIVLAILASHLLLRREIAGVRHGVAGIRRDIAGLAERIARLEGFMKAILGTSYPQSAEGSRALPER